MPPKPTKNFIYIAGFFFSAHLALTSYINSTVIGQNVNESWIGVIYAISAILTIGMLWILPMLVEKFGARTLALWLCGFVLLSLLGLSYGVGFMIPLFFVYLTTNTLVIFSLDLLLESYSEDNTTGSTRGLYLTILNFAWIFAPIVTGFLIERFGYSTPYGLGFALVAFSFITLLVGLKNFKDPIYKHAHLSDSFKLLKENRNIRYGALANLTLHFFYAWMVIFAPIYLHEQIGFSWAQIGIAFMVMLTTFVIIEYPLGKLADKKLGEKELLIIGFLTMSVSTLAFALLGHAPLASYAIILFLTRVGASITEVMSETYFFKQIDASQASAIGLFRSLTPLGYVIGPLLGALIVSVWSLPILFITLACILPIGAIFTWQLKDTN